MHHPPSAYEAAALLSELPRKTVPRASLPAALIKGPSRPRASPRSERAPCSAVRRRREWRRDDARQSEMHALWLRAFLACFLRSHCSLHGVAQCEHRALSARQGNGEARNSGGPCSQRSSHAVVDRGSGRSPARHRATRSLVMRHDPPRPRERTRVMPDTPRENQCLIHRATVRYA